jgi:AAA+ superfamily predicted ATPase
MSTIVRTLTPVLQARSCWPSSRSRTRERPKPRTSSRSRDPDLPWDTAVVDAEAWTAEIGDALTAAAASLPDAPDFVVVNGDDRMRRRQFGCAASAAERFLSCSAPDDERSWSALAREATIGGRGVVVEVTDALAPAGRQWIDRARHLSWVVSARSGPPLDALPERVRLEITAPALEPTDDEWVTALGTDVERTHRLTFDQLQRVAKTREATGGDGDAAVRRLASGQLEQLTRRIPPTRTWDDIVVSPDRLELLRSIVERYRHAAQVYDEWGFEPTPSRGLVALFSGPSGTGKTLAAEIIAGALGLDVFKLDLSSVVSKYIGETENNLEQVFDAASAGNMVLFFDEADSLFGKRSDVKDARDRYANIEVSYLLQRLEAYDGLVIMATNFEKNVDSAFLRRIHVRVAFALPGVEERSAIWRRNMPPAAPVGDIDVDWLAERFEPSGGAIRNATVQAAFAAASGGTDITMKTAVVGVAREYRKLGRLVKEQDFGPHFDDVSE